MKFPLFVRPYKDEVLSSWLVRNAISHDLKYISLLDAMGLRNSYFRDIDLFPNEGLVDKLSYYFPQTKIGINNLTLVKRKENFILFETNPAIIWAFICLGPKHRFNKDKRFVFCPECLFESNYCRKNWRYSFYVVCNKHHCMMLDACQNCESPFNYMRSETGNLSIKRTLSFDKCERCGFSNRLAMSEKVSMKNYSAQTDYLSLIENGCNSICHFPLQYFLGIEIIISALFSRRSRGQRLYKELISLINEEECLELMDSKNFSLVSLDSRLQAVRVLSYINQLGDRFYELLREVSFAKSYFTHSAKYVPFWLDSRLTFR